MDRSKHHHSVTPSFFCVDLSFESDNNNYLGLRDIHATCCAKFLLHFTTVLAKITYAHRSLSSLRPARLDLYRLVGRKTNGSKLGRVLNFELPHGGECRSVFRKEKDHARSNEVDRPDYGVYGNAASAAIATAQAFVRGTVAPHATTGDPGDARMSDARRRSRQAIC